MKRTGMVPWVLMAGIAVVAGGCSSSAGRPNIPLDAGEAGVADVASDKSGSPDHPPDVAQDMSGSPDHPLDVAPDEGSPEAGGTDGRDGGGMDCHLAIDASLPFVCVSMFDDSSWRHNICDTAFGPSSVVERVCSGFQARTIDYGTHRWTCYYDATTLALVGGDFTDDTSSFCGNTSVHEIAGDVPAGGCTGVTGQGVPCGSDGGGQ